MNLSKLFEMQRVLDNHIMDEHPELKGKNNLDWKILALFVELGECANEWRGFKKWSKDQEPRYQTVKWEIVKESPIINEFITNLDAEINYAVVEEVVRKPLLEEFVDCLHFILSIGLEIERIPILTPSIVPNNILSQFNELYFKIGNLWCLYDEFGISEDLFDYYDDLFIHFMNLGNLLGFTWEQIEQAYFEKNAINHSRQESGY